MIYSRSAEYALRALIQLAALPPDEYAMAKNIAAEGNIPAHFLAKILQDLAFVGIDVRPRLVRPIERYCVAVDAARRWNG